MLFITFILVIGLFMVGCDNPTSSDGDKGTTYTLSFSPNSATGGEPPAPKKAQAGDSVTLPGNTGSMSKENFVFGGWNTKADGTGTPYGAGSDFTMPNSDTTLYAKWNDAYTIPIYTVSFDANGASGAAPAAVTDKAGYSFLLPDQFGLSKIDYEFDGWNTNADGTGTNYSPGTSYTIAGNITLYAHWAQHYTITYKDVGGGTFSGTHQSGYPTTYTYGTETVLDKPTKIGYNFGGWFTNSDGTGTAITSLSATGYTANITLYAKWYPVPIITMVSIPAGTFTMGSPTSEPNRGSDENQHQVTLSAFSMGKYEVTQEQYQAVMGTNPSYYTSNADPGEVQGKRPVETVSWYDAIVFCNKLSMQEGLTPAYRINGSTDPAFWGIVPTSSDATWNAAAIVAGSTGYRLPTEAQWEYACRAGSTTAWYTGSAENAALQAAAWYSINSNSKTHEVGKKTSNAWGLYDMMGNVFEWCWDWYGTYPSGAQTNPTGASSGTYRVIRGGLWYASASYLRSAYRVNSLPYIRFSYYYSFRLVRP